MATLYLKEKTSRKLIGGLPRHNLEREKPENYFRDMLSSGINPCDKKLSSTFLLKDVEIFSREMIKLNPKSCLGYWFMSWVRDQLPSFRKVHPLAAAADCYKWLKKTIEVADQEGGYIASAAARIDACFCIYAGGKGMLQIPSQMSIVRRNFGTEFSKELGGLLGAIRDDDDSTRSKEFQLHIRLVGRVPHAPNQPGRVMQYEVRRKKEQKRNGTSNTDLEPDAYTLVEVRPATIIRLLLHIRVMLVYQEQSIPNLKFHC